MRLKLESMQNDQRRGLKLIVPGSPSSSHNHSNFLPDAGKLIHTRPPISAPHRLETGFSEGDEISSFYDPMVSRLNHWTMSRC